MLDISLEDEKAAVDRHQASYHGTICISHLLLNLCRGCVYKYDQGVSRFVVDNLFCSIWRLPPYGSGAYPYMDGTILVQKYRYSIGVSVSTLVPIQSMSSAIFRYGEADA